MADLIFLNPYREEDFSLLDRDGLTQRLEDIRTLIAQLDRQEPKNMMSEAYEQWGDAHEELEDLEDVILDLLDEIAGSGA